MFPKLARVPSLAWRRGSEKPQIPSSPRCCSQAHQPRPQALGGQKTSEAIWLNLCPPFLSLKGPG